MLATPVAHFNPAMSANELGLYTRIGAQISCVPDPVYPAPVHLVRQIRREFDPGFIPLWCNIWWKSPNGGVVKTGHHMLARHVLHPRAHAPVIKGLLLPLTPTYGLVWRPPILLATILDGLSDEERNQGALPRYVPFDGSVVQSMRYAMHRRDNVHPVVRVAEAEEAEQARQAGVWKDVVDGVEYRKKNERLRIKRALGQADFVYVTSQKKGAA